MKTKIVSRKITIPLLIFEEDPDINQSLIKITFQKNQTVLCLKIKTIQPRKGTDELNKIFFDRFEIQENSSLEDDEARVRRKRMIS